MGSTMSMLDTSIVNVALRTLSAELHASLTTVQWVITAYLLAMAAVVPVTGWLARRAGTRRTYRTIMCITVSIRKLYVNGILTLSYAWYCERIHVRLP